jgi:hypothetical protein
MVGQEFQTDHGQRGDDERQQSAMDRANEGSRRAEAIDKRAQRFLAVGSFMVFGQCSGGRPAHLREA